MTEEAQRRGSEPDRRRRGGERREHRSLPTRPPPNLDRIRIVLVEPQTAGNIGAAARALKTMGISDLVVVRRSPFRDHPEARMFAHGALDVLEHARRVVALEEALEGTHWVVGTTHRRRARFRDLAVPLPEAARRIFEWSSTHRVAVLFGREDRGLLDEETARCRIMTTIPTAGENPSLNLAQAVMVTAYEIFLASHGEIETPPRDLAETWEIEAMYERIYRSLERMEFRPIDDDPEKFIRSLRRIFATVPLERRDVRTIHRIFQQVDFYVRKYGPASGGETGPCARETAPPGGE